MSVREFARLKFACFGIVRLGSGPVTLVTLLFHNLSPLADNPSRPIASQVNVVYTTDTMDTRDLGPKDLRGLFFIRDALRYRGRTPTMQAISDQVGFKSRRSAMLLIERLIKKGYLARTPTGGLRVLRVPEGIVHMERTIELPLVGSAPCGLPLLAEENIETMIPVSQKIARPGATYYLLRAVGDSMNRANIEDGDLVIVRQQPTANNGDRVVALIDDEATIKELSLRGDKVVLLPRSSNPKHQPIIMDRDFMVQGVVVGTVPRLVDDEGAV